MCGSFIASHSGLSLTSYQWCSTKKVNIMVFMHILLILLCFHWLPATAMELLWCIVFCRFCRDGLLDLKELSSLGVYFAALYTTWLVRITMSNSLSGKRTRRKTSAIGDREIKRKDKEGCESFSEIPRGLRLAYETAYVECIWRRHLVVSSHV